MEPALCSPIGSSVNEIPLTMPMRRIRDGTLEGIPAERTRSHGNRPSGGGHVRLRAPTPRGGTLEDERILYWCQPDDREKNPGAVRADRPATPTFCPLHIEGTIRHPGSGEPWEYAVVVQVHDDQGKTISRHVMGDGPSLPQKGEPLPCTWRSLPPRSPPSDRCHGTHLRAIQFRLQ